MKIEEMAELLDGLASFTEKFAGKSNYNDLRAMSHCLRQFSGETVSAVCSFITKAKEGKPARGRASPAVDQAKVEAMIAKVQYFLDNQRALGYSHIAELLNDLNKLKLPEIKAFGERMEFPLGGKTKAAAVNAVRNWLESVKSSAAQSSFHLSGAGSS